MSNKNISAKERNLIKGAIRRVFSRSDLRRAVIATAIIEHYDPDRPRVKKWGRCKACDKPTALYQMNIDHIDPIIPVHLSLEEMSWDTVINRTWCDQNNLQPICVTCHNIKTKAERKIRREHKKGKKQK